MYNFIILTLYENSPIFLIKENRGCPVVSLISPYRVFYDVVPGPLDLRLRCDDQWRPTGTRTVKETEMKGRRFTSTVRDGTREWVNFRLHYRPSSLL